MFLPEDLLFKSGQLARVWLAANQHKKLTKAQVLQDKIDEDIQVIIRPEGAAGGPLALRLNAQLLLGVVRIYSRKAHYLHDDCNDALWKIKMAFRPGNIDLPAQTHVANPTSLTLPDMITDLDLLAPMPDPSFLLSQTLDNNLNLGNTTIPDWDNSQFLSGSIEQPRMELVDDEDDLGINIGEDDLDPAFNDTSIEIGRNAPLERRQSEEFASGMKELLDDGDDLGINIGEDDETEIARAPELEIGGDDISMGGMTDLDPPVGSVTASIAGDLPHLPAQREDSPLSELDEEEATALEQEIAQQNNTTFEPELEEEESIHQARAKRRRVIGQDAETMIPSHQLREQQNNRDRILKPASFLPRDPLLLALLNMQKTGGFVSNILGDGRSQGWAPELRGIMSLEVVSRPSQKRKRDKAIADLTTEDDGTAEGEKTPQLEFEQEDPSVAGLDMDIGRDSTVPAGSDDIIQLPDEPAFPRIDDDENDDAFSAVPDHFDDTTAPLVHPAEAGPISLGTKHAVHLLRERLGPEPQDEEPERQRTSTFFQDMLPEARTSRIDATKMFFEVLVLATKDAIKIEQPVNELGGPLRIRAKRSLWGEWADQAVSRELASQAQPIPQSDHASGAAVQPGPPEVAVSA